MGRSTEDLAVDIDLGREKRGSKISRRQVIDASFYVFKVLGCMRRKGPEFVTSFLCFILCLVVECRRSYDWVMTGHFI